MNRNHVATLALLVTAGIAGRGWSQPQPDMAGVMAAQRQALAELDFMDGTWRGPAWTVLPSGEKHTMTQTERVGPFLDGAVKVIEGRGHETDGRLGFNAFGIVSYDPGKRAYTMRAYAQGRVGDFPLTRTSDGFTWEIAAGPATIRYTAVIKDTTWHEYGERILAGAEPVRFHGMTLTRLGDTDWPASGAVGMR